MALHLKLRSLLVDVTDTVAHLIGKQRLYPAVFLYTSIGYLATVWLESVPMAYIKDLKMTTNIDGRSIEFDIDRTENGVVMSKIFFKSFSRKKNMG